MGSIKVWTKQNENVLKELESKGRYTAKREYIIKDWMSMQILSLRSMTGW